MPDAVARRAGPLPSERMPTTVVERVDTVYAGWLSLRAAHLRDQHGARFVREVEHHGDGVAVLPYDPERRVALVVRMARAPVLLAGESSDLVEVPAGLLEAGEEPAAAVRREAFEEAGVELADLTALGFVWTMPGISTERMWLFLGAYGAAARTGAGGGLAAENETITVEEVPLATLAAMADAHALTDMRTLTLLLRLRLLRPDLF